MNKHGLAWVEFCRFRKDKGCTDYGKKIDLDFGRNDPGYYIVIIVLCRLICESLKWFNQKYMKFDWLFFPLVPIYFPSVLFQIERLNLIEDSKLSPDTDSAFADALQQLWQHAAVLLIDDSLESSQWFLGLYSALVEATCCSVDSFSNAQIIYVRMLLLITIKVVLLHEHTLECIFNLSCV